MIVLVLGATGLLGNAMYRVLSENGSDQIFGTIRNEGASSAFIPELRERLLPVRDLSDIVELTALIDKVQPNVIINSLSLDKSAPQDITSMIPIYSLLPRLLAHICRQHRIRLVQISSDGVFSGNRGSYTEEDLPDATQPYGIAKLLGEVEQSNTITLRTSIIGPELASRNALLEWFLSQGEECRCYTRAVFSGFPSIVLSQLVRDIILPRPDLHGIFHIAAQPISKFDLLQLVARIYQKTIRIIPDDTVVIDRSLSAERFTQATGYIAPPWPALVESMRNYNFGLKD